jgi:hypothetical protein
MGFPETPVTDIELIKSDLKELKEIQAAMNERLSGQASGINDLGLNMQWIVQNVGNIFQMFSNPAFMSQLLGTITGAQGNGGQQDVNGPADPTGPGGH